MGHHAQANYNGSNRHSPPIRNPAMSLQIADLFAEREAERYSLHTRYLNEQMVRVLKTIGFDRRYRRARGQPLERE